MTRPGPVPEWHAHRTAAISDTVYARDREVHLVYQVVGDGGPDLLFVPTATFPIDLLWDEPTVAGHKAGVVQPLDVDRPAGAVTPGVGHRSPRGGARGPRTARHHAAVIAVAGGGIEFAELLLMLGKRLGRRFQRCHNAFRDQTGRLRGHWDGAGGGNDMSPSKASMLAYNASAALSTTVRCDATSSASRN
jgi:hypothetical protein